MLGDIASIATLILFVFYFIGRFISVIRERNIFPDNIMMFPSNYDRSTFDIVETFEIEKNSYNIFVLTSECGIYELAVYQILYDKELNRIGRQKIEPFQCAFLNKNQSIEFCVTSPEIFITHEIEYYTPDYKKVTIALWDNPKNGVMSESAIPRNTLRSVLYHLVK